MTLISGSTPSFQPMPDATSARQLDRFLWLLVVLLVLGGMVVALVRGYADRPNWGSLKEESRYVWAHHATSPGTKMFGYLPTAVFLLWPFTVWLPHPAGLILYVTTNALGAAVSLWIAARFWRTATQQCIPLAIPAALIAANLQHGIQANQLTIWTLVLVMGGMTLIAREREWWGGILLGLACLIKVLPFFLVGYLLCRARWRAIGSLVIALFVFDLVPSVCFFGFDGMVREHRLWLQRASWHSNGSQIREPLLVGVLEHIGNSSFSSVLTRWLRGMPDADEMVVVQGPAPSDSIASQQMALKPRQVLLLAPMPPRDGQPWSVHVEPIGSVPRFRIAHWSSSTIYGIWSVSVTVGVAALAWYTWRTRSNQSDWPAAVALWILAMLFVAPMMRHYYLALALPALAIVWRTMAEQITLHQGRWISGTRLAAVALLGWLVGVCLLGWDLGKWYGLHLFVLLILMAATAWAWWVQSTMAQGLTARPTASGDNSSSRGTNSSGA